MDQIGILLKTARENSGINLDEVSVDLNIKELILFNIEEGNIGCFKDIFVLKDYIYDYAKYLGLNPDKQIDSFNEYLFESTSKIPVKEIEKAVREKQSEEAHTEKKITSPYTVPSKKRKTKTLTVIIFATLIVLIATLSFFVIREITSNSIVATSVNHIK